MLNDEEITRKNDKARKRENEKRKGKERDNIIDERERECLTVFPDV